MSAPLIYEAASFRGGPDGDTSATFTRWPGSPVEPLVRGQRITFSGDFRQQQWRVTEIRTHPDGSETYGLLPAEIVDARIEAARVTP